MPVLFNSKKITTLLSWCLLFIMVCNFSVILFHFNGFLQNGISKMLFNLLYVDRESNIPTFFNTILLLMATALLFITFLLHRNSNAKYYWLILSFIFLFLSIDESISIHESLTHILPQFGIGGKGYFLFAWIIPYSIMVVLIFLFFIRLLLSLQKPIRAWLVLSGGTYLLGALVFEMIGAGIAENQGVKNITYALVASCEEMFEMGGLIIFINTILKYIRFQFEFVSINIK